VRRGDLANEICDLEFAFSGKRLADCQPQQQSRCFLNPAHNVIGTVHTIHSRSARERSRFPPNGGPGGSPTLALALARARTCSSHNSLADPITGNYSPRSAVTTFTQPLRDPLPRVANKAGKIKLRTNIVGRFFTRRDEIYAVIKQMTPRVAAVRDYARGWDAPRGKACHQQLYELLSANSALISSIGCNR